MDARHVIKHSRGVSPLPGFIISVHNIHRSEAVWEDPTQFNPDRFLKVDTRRLKPCTFIPFSFGSRACIGKDFSLAVTKIFLVKLLRMFNVNLSEEGAGAESVSYSDYISLRISSPLKVSLQRTRINKSRFGNKPIGTDRTASKQPIRTRYLGHVTGYQPIRYQYFLIRSVPATKLSF
eukprot:sb/3471793/